MKILITGIAGFIGSHLAERLCKDHEVHGVDDMSTGNVNNIKHLDVYLIRRNICDRWWDGTKYDQIYHLASPASPVAYYNDPIGTLLTGSRGTRNVVEVALETGARLLLASTSEVYGDPLVHPQHEEYWGNVNPIGPRSCYDEAKRFSEALLMAYHRVHGLDTRIARIFNTYGERMGRNDGRVIPNFITQCLAGVNMTLYGTGKQTRSFCYVKDTVEGLVSIMEYGDSYPFNVGNPHEVTMASIAETIKILTESDSKISYKPLYADDPQQRKPDIQRISTIGWRPRTGLIEGLTNTIEHFT